MFDTRALLERIEALPPERIADFVDIIARRERLRDVSRAAAASSEAAFAAVWNNPEDDVYRSL